MLAVVALWSAAPVFACLTLGSCHACCRAMKMDSGATAMGSGGSCCPSLSPNTTVPAVNPVAPELQMDPVQAIASVKLPDIVDLSGQRLISAKAPPPRSLLGASSILRI